MAAVTAAMVKALRERTGAGMMACKKALVECDGDIEAAETAIAKAGHKKAAKSASRTAAEGIIVTRLSNDDRLGAILEVNCETDFVARDESFKAFVEKTLGLVEEHQIEDVEALKALPYDESSTLEEARQTLITRIGENIQIRRAALLEAPDVVGTYIHMGRIGVLVALKGGDAALAKDMAMQIAASKPEYLTPSEVPADRAEKEKGILISQAEGSGKPPEIIEKMVEGRLKKYFNEICLVGQPFIKNPDETVGDILAAKGASIVGYQRFEAGEGIEKKATMTFAEEVQAQVKGS